MTSTCHARSISDKFDTNIWKLSRQKMSATPLFGLESCIKGYVGHVIEELKRHEVFKLPELG